MSDILVRVVTEDGESVEFERDTVVIRHLPEGVRISPKRTVENTLGFLSVFYPWGTVRQIKEFERA